MSKLKENAKGLTDYLTRVFLKNIGKVPADTVTKTELPQGQIDKYNEAVSCYDSLKNDKTQEETIKVAAIFGILYFLEMSKEEPYKAVEVIKDTKVVTKVAAPKKEVKKTCDDCNSYAADACSRGARGQEACGNFM